MSDEQTDGLTTAEAVQYARDLRAYAAVVRNPDPANDQYLPYYEPYAPSDDVAYKLCSQVGADEAVELMAHSRLCDAQRIGRCRDRALLNHGVEQMQQMAVQIQMIKFFHGINEDCVVYFMG